MKLISLEPPYSFYFSDLIKEVGKKFPFSEFESFLPDSDFNCYLPGFKKNYLDFDSNYEPSDKEVAYVKNLKNLVTVNESFSDVDARFLAICYKGIELFFLNNRDSIVFIYNDLRWFHSLVIDVLLKYGIKFVVFERGVFRPYTTTFDRLGVNASSNIAKEDFDDSFIYKVDEHIYFRHRKDHWYIKPLFVFFIIKRYFMKRGDGNPLSNINKLSPRKSIKEYFELYLSSAKNSGDKPSRPFIFVPLQLSNDTQTLINSKFNSTQEFIDRVFSDFLNSEFYEKYDLVFKVHPMDSTSYNFDPRAIVSSYDTLELVRSAVFCVTINSTVGFEASFIKPVVCCGESFYTSHGFVSFADLNENIFNNIDFKKVANSNYKNFILQNYQLPGSIFNYSSSDIKKSAEIIYMTLFD